MPSWVRGAPLIPISSAPLEETERSCGVPGDFEIQISHRWSHICAFFGTFLLRYSLNSNVAQLRYDIQYDINLTDTARSDLRQSSVTTSPGASRTPKYDINRQYGYVLVER